MAQRLSTWVQRVAVLGLLGCGKLFDPIGGCSEQDIPACEAACQANKEPRYTCTTAAQALWEKATAAHPDGGAERSPDGQHAIDYYDKACESGDGHACKLRVHYASGPFDPDQIREAPATTLPTFDEQQLAERATQLFGACDRRVEDSCLLLGDLRLGSDAAAARQAYSHGCREAGAPDHCKWILRDVDRAERYRTGCEQDVARACGCLANLIYLFDPPRALAVFRKEARLRRLDPETWTKARMEALFAPRWLRGTQLLQYGSLRLSPPPTPAELDEVIYPCEPSVGEKPSEPPPRPEVLERAQCTLGETQIPEAVPSEPIKAVLQGLEEPLRRCYASGLAVNPLLAGHITVYFVIDAVGDAQQPKHKADLPHLGVVQCLLRHLSQQRFPPPKHGTIEITARFDCAPAKK